MFCTRKQNPLAQGSFFLSRFTTLSTPDAFTSVITVLMSSAKETKDRFKIQVEQLPLND
jgi:hypothetical protein